MAPNGWSMLVLFKESESACRPRIDAMRFHRKGLADKPRREGRKIGQGTSSAKTRPCARISPIGTIPFGSSALCGARSMASEPPTSASARAGYPSGGAGPSPGAGFPDPTSGARQRPRRWPSLSAGGTSHAGGRRSSNRRRDASPNTWDFFRRPRSIRKSAAGCVRPGRESNPGTPCRGLIAREKRRDLVERPNGLVRLNREGRSPRPAAVTFLSKPRILVRRVRDARDDSN